MRVSAVYARIWHKIRATRTGDRAKPPRDAQSCFNCSVGGVAGGRRGRTRCVSRDGGSVSRGCVRLLREIGAGIARKSPGTVYARLSRDFRVIQPHETARIRGPSRETSIGQRSAELAQGGEKGKTISNGHPEAAGHPWGEGSASTGAGPSPRLRTTNYAAAQDDILCRHVRPNVLAQGVKAVADGARLSGAFYDVRFHQHAHIVLEHTAAPVRDRLRDVADHQLATFL